MASAVQAEASRVPRCLPMASAVQAEASRVPRCLPLASALEAEASRVPRCLPLASAVQAGASSGHVQQRPSRSGSPAAALYRLTRMAIPYG